MIGRNQVHIYYVTCDGLPVKNVRKFKYNVYLDTLLASDGYQVWDHSLTSLFVMVDVI